MHILRWGILFWATLYTSIIRANSSITHFAEHALDATNMQIEWGKTTSASVQGDVLNVNYTQATQTPINQTIAGEQLSSAVKNSVSRYQWEDELTAHTLKYDTQS